MFHGLFGYDNAISKFFRTIGNIWYLHILWLVTSLPVITVGASTTALLYSMMKLHEEDGYPTENFFHSFKLNFRQATGLYLIYLAVGAVIAADLVIANQMMGDGGKGFWIDFTDCGSALCTGTSVCFCGGSQIREYHSGRRSAMHSDCPSGILKIPSRC
jgi:hypothetical protein